MKEQAAKHGEQSERSRRGISLVVGVVLLLVTVCSMIWLTVTAYQKARTAVYDSSVFYIQIGNCVLLLVWILMAVSALYTLHSAMQKKIQQLEEEKLQAESGNKAKSQFLSNMAHDIRTPMNAIIGFTNLALQSGDDARKMQEYLERIQFSGNHLLALLNDVLEINQIESGKTEMEEKECDLCRLMEDIHDMAAEQMKEKKLAFSVDTKGVKDRKVFCDRNRFNRVLLNLLSNANKYTPEGGSVSVILTQTEMAKEYGSYELRVRDTGVGMTEEFAASLFDLLEKERSSTLIETQGTGLGMAIIKSLVDQMQGTIHVTTAPEKGTEFVVCLKLRLQKEDNPDELLAAKEKNEEEIKKYAGRRILLVDDNLVNREIAKEILTSYGFVVEEAAGGEEAVSKVGDSKEGYYDLILMDVQMPGMNGYEATRKIRELDDFELAHLPIIAMTANAFDEDISAAKDSGMNAHIAKPLDVPKMVETLNRVLSVFY